MVRHSRQADVLAPYEILRTHEELRDCDYIAHHCGKADHVLPVAEERGGHGGNEKNTAAAHGDPREVQKGPEPREPGNDEALQGPQGQPPGWLSSHGSPAAVFRCAL